MKRSATRVAALLLTLIGALAGCTAPGAPATAAAPAPAGKADTPLDELPVGAHRYVQALAFEGGAPFDLARRDPRTPDFVQLAGAAPANAPVAVDDFPNVERVGRVILPQLEAPERSLLALPLAYSVYRARVEAPGRLTLRSDSAGTGPFPHLGLVRAKASSFRALDDFGVPLSFVAGHPSVAPEQLAAASHSHGDKRVILLQRQRDVPVVLLAHRGELVVLRDVHGEELFEMPAIIGAGTTPENTTPTNHRFYIYALFFSINMTPHLVNVGDRREIEFYENPGVGFVMAFDPRGRLNMHNSPWWYWHPDWMTAPDPQAHYGSAGCVNLPDARWRQFPVAGLAQPIGAAELIFRWVSSGVACDAERSGIAADGAGHRYSMERCQVPLISADTVDDLRRLDAHGAELAEHYRALVAQRAAAGATP